MLVADSYYDCKQVRIDNMQRLQTSKAAVRVLNWGLLKPAKTNGIYNLKNTEARARGGSSIALKNIQLVRTHV